jgi:branched-subunit amino acid transport protein
VSLWVFAAIVVITYLSRAAALVWLGRPDGRVEEVLSRMPAPIFAGLAAVSLIGDDGGLGADLPMLLAAAGALMAGVRRSLAWSLGGGVVGWLLGTLLLG